ncbi:hypothetical protein AWY89_10535 [Pasteurella multocida subsp. multocida]|nr:hypothetical protein AWY89_10535 [Pasteurella multocida subsp. multocida]
MRKKAYRKIRLLCLEDRLKVELEHAFRNRSRVADTKNKWEGTTKSGVKVEWVINKDGYLSTVYPTEKQ